MVAFKCCDLSANIAHLKEMEYLWRLCRLRFTGILALSHTLCPTVAVASHGVSPECTSLRRRIFGGSLTCQRHAALRKPRLSQDLQPDPQEAIHGNLILANLARPVSTSLAILVLLIVAFPVSQAALLVLLPPGHESAPFLLEEQLPGPTPTEQQGS